MYPNLPATNQSQSLISSMAGNFGIEPRKFYDTLKATAFRSRDGGAPTDEEMMALLIVADQYKLNPFTREIYAFPAKGAGIVPVVGVDGWTKIMNSHPQFDGVEFKFSPETIQIDPDAKQCPEWVECLIYRKDRTRPTRTREYLDECYKPAFKGKGDWKALGPWQSHTKRFLRHKALIQTARLAFGFSGIHDEDDAPVVAAGQTINGEIVRPINSQQPPPIAPPIAPPVTPPTAPPVTPPAPPATVTPEVPDAPLPTNIDGQYVDEGGITFNPNVHGQTQDGLPSYTPSGYFRKRRNVKKPNGNGLHNPPAPTVQQDSVSHTPEPQPVPVQAPVQAPQESTEPDFFGDQE